MGQYQRSETIGTSFGEKTCGVYLDAVSVGNGNTTVSTLEWIGEGTNIIYMTEITVIQNGAKIVERTTLKDTNMISEESPGHAVEAIRIGIHKDRSRQGGLHRVLEVR